MSTIAFDSLYVDETLITSSGINGILVNKNISYTTPFLALSAMNPQTLVSVGSVSAVVTGLQSQITTLQAQIAALQSLINNIPGATQNVNIVPGSMENQYYLRASVGNNQFNILSTMFTPE